MKFRPCIDLHNGVVKQIVGSTLSENASEAPVENFVASKPAVDFARYEVNFELISIEKSFQCSLSFSLNLNVIRLTFSNTNTFITGSIGTMVCMAAMSSC